MDDLQIPPLIFIPFVENCFKHGAKAVAADFYVHIRLTAVNRTLIFSAENNIRPGYDTHDSGTGLKNIKRRLELLYPGAHNLNVGKQKNIYRVHLEIRL
jgi:LytS/YehU family sensor histidine kinase